MLILLTALTLALAALTLALWGQLRAARNEITAAYDETDDARAEAQRWRGVARIHETAANEVRAECAEWRAKVEAAADRTFPAAPASGDLTYAQVQLTAADLDETPAPVFDQLIAEQFATPIRKPRKKAAK
jgi:hypothetical protein